MGEVNRPSGFWFLSSNAEKRDNPSPPSDWCHIGLKKWVGTTCGAGGISARRPAFFFLSAEPNLEGLRGWTLESGCLYSNLSTTTNSSKDLE